MPNTPESMAVAHTDALRAFRTKATCAVTAQSLLPEAQNVIVAKPLAARPPAQTAGPRCNTNGRGEVRSQCRSQSAPKFGKFPQWTGTAS